MPKVCWISAVTLLSLSFGCAQWDGGKWKSDRWQITKSSAVPETDVKMAPNRLSPDSVVLEIAVGQLDIDQQDDLEALWRQVDKQAISLATRKKLDQNGIQVGVVGSQIPAVLNRLLAEKSVDTTEFEQWQKDFIERSQQTTVPRMILHQRIQNNKGESHVTPLSDPMEQASWTVQIDDRTTAGRGEQVRGYLGLRTYPGGDRGVRIVVYPEIRHGQPRSKIGVANDTFLFQTEQTIQVIEDLQFEVNLRPGETLLVGPNHLLSGLGGMLFGASQDADFYQRVIMIRLVQSQRNDLFESSSSY